MKLLFLSIFLSCFIVFSLIDSAFALDNLSESKVPTGLLSITGYHENGNFRTGDTVKITYVAENPLSLEFHAIISLNVTNDKQEEIFYDKKEIPFLSSTNQIPLSWDLVIEKIGNYTVHIDVATKYTDHNDNFIIKEATITHDFMVEPTRSAISSDQITSTVSGKDFDIEISGLDESYRLNKPIEFGVVVRGLGCGETRVQIFKENSELSSIKEDSIISSCVELSNPILSGDSASLGVYINSNDNRSTVIEQTGNYKVLAWFIQANGTQYTTEKFFSIIQNSPKYQIEHGILAMNIVCRDNFVLLLKTSNEQSACVKPESIAKLVERGWAINKN